ncbi:MAG: hypothetical protein BGO25_01005 [Acidobacteriales bacterium 59-55]|nr:MAG: hypothetical protein BGO25_01005 [Acidobacteriales bacterium 59-55]
MPTGFCHTPGEIDGGQGLTLAGAWAGDQDYASFWMLIAQATMQNLILFYGKTSGFGHEDQTRFLYGQRRCDTFHRQ